MTKGSLALDRRSQSEAEIVCALKDAVEDLPPPEHVDDFGAIFERFGDAEIVLLGEATHGTSEFHRARTAISRHLIRNCGYSIVAIEADWPDAGRIDRYIRHGSSQASAEKAFERFPSWMWRNVEVLDFVEWLRRENEHREPKTRVEIRGLDIYSLQASIAAVLHYLDRVDRDAASEARRRYGCLTPWQDQPARYGHRAAMGGDTCEVEVREQLLELLNRRLEFAARDGETFFDAAQNARVVRTAERYYRAMYEGSRDSWNLRDRHMFDTLQALMRHRGPDTKAIVWAHNSHVGNAAATSMGWEGEFNIGELCRMAYGNRLAAIGFGTDTGTVAAASDWDAAMEIMEIRPAREDSYEHLFRRTAHARALFDWRAQDRSRLRDALAHTRLERAIGVIYRPDNELMSHYFHAELSAQFDAFVWFETTRAVTALPSAHAQGKPETYPFGL